MRLFSFNPSEKAPKLADPHFWVAKKTTVTSVVFDSIYFWQKDWMLSLRDYLPRPMWAILPITSVLIGLGVGTLAKLIRDAVRTYQGKTHEEILDQEEKLKIVRNHFGLDASSALSTLCYTALGVMSWLAPEMADEVMDVLPPIATPVAIAGIGYLIGVKVCDYLVDAGVVKIVGRDDDHSDSTESRYQNSMVSV